MIFDFCELVFDSICDCVCVQRFDAVVGDIAIVTNRTKTVDFTQPYTESGLVVVAPLRKLNSSPWAFMQPFTLSMWLVTGLFFLIIGFVVWILEHKINDEFRGPPRKQLITVLWCPLHSLISIPYTLNDLMQKSLFHFVLLCFNFKQVWILNNVLCTQ